MSDYIDLHLHTDCSDGSYTSKEIVQMAAEAGLRAISICDHDTLDGTDAALAAGQMYDVEVITGVELSVVWEEYNDVHLLGYGYDHHNPKLCQNLQEFRDFRRNRNVLIVERVNARLLEQNREPLDVADVQRRAAGAIGRPHIAMALIDHGYVRTTEEAFQKYLIPCNVPKRLFAIQEAIDLIHAAGGVAVLAHPQFIDPHRSVLLKLFDSFQQLGLDGIEAYNSGSSNDDIDWTITAAVQRKLLVTGGSDFHGSSKGDIVIGRGRGNLKTPYRCVEAIYEAIARRTVQ
ncbi:MAG: PHP domain-containing protein [Desulfuromonadales bacterium]|nr:PHP domain-containing protein [Desulfuromonadales bacterium]